MCRYGWLAIAALLLTGNALAQVPPPLPEGAEALATRLSTRVGPQTQAWIRTEAARERAADAVSEAEAAKAVRANRSLGKLNDADVSALAFLVMMEAQKSAREDLKAIMSGVKSINDAKAALRQAQSAARATSTAPAPAVTTVARPAAPAVKTVVVVTPLALSKAEFAARLERAKGSRDSLDELGEMESLRLQMAMDRQSKMMSALSNLMKKMSDTSQTITQNLK